MFVYVRLLPVGHHKCLVNNCYCYPFIYELITFAAMQCISLLTTFLPCHKLHHKLLAWNEPINKLTPSAVLSGAVSLHLYLLIIARIVTSDEIRLPFLIASSHLALIHAGNISVPFTLRISDR